MEELILKVKEFKEKMVEVVNNSKLPAFILKTILEELLQQIEILEQQEYQEALKLKEEKEIKKDKSKKYEVQQ